MLFATTSPPQESTIIEEEEAWDATGIDRVPSYRQLEPFAVGVGGQLKEIAKSVADVRVGTENGTTKPPAGFFKNFFC